MTREEAIRLIWWLKYTTNREDDLEEIAMAIEALSANTISRKDTVTLNSPISIQVTSTQVVRCKDCRHADECHKSVQYTRNEQNTVTIGYSPIEWCSRGERREP
ncbi:MAG: hypothetical protein IKE94_06665 [Aeriscardovia sp.]|nr:hypothetical protein [Aeriscardovia sp.]